MPSVPQSEIETWSLIIRPRRAWLDLRLGELWQYRNLIVQFVWRDFVSVYKQTILGPLWYIIQPILVTLTFTVIFGNIARLPTDGMPQFLFYLSGTVVWAYFADCINKTSQTFIMNAHLFGKVYFPRLAVPVSILFSNLISFGIQFLLFIGFVVYYNFAGLAHTNVWVLLTPILLLIMAGLGLGLGIIVSSLTTRYRDLRFLVTFGVQLLMYATPVIYPASSVPGQFHWLIQANPLTHLFEAFRFAYLGVGEFSGSGLVYSAGIMVVFLIIGALLFNRVEATFMDTV